MKLATLKDGTRDGTLLVVSKDLKRALKADHVAPTLQAALDDWNYVSPLLSDLSNELELRQASRAFDLDFKQLMAPLPRAYQFADGSAYLIHAELIRRSRKQELPADAKREPLMYQGCSDPLLGPCDDIAVATEAHDIDLEMELGVITGDVPMGVDKDRAGEAIRLLVLLNDVSLRALVPADLARGFGFFHSKPPSSFVPVAVTPDELGDAWQGGRLHLTLHSSWNGRKVGMCDAGPEMTFHFGQLIAHICKTRNVRAGSIVGSGTVSNKDWSKGYSCIAEKRCIETIEDGAPKTPFMQYGDSIRIEMKGRDGQSVFGAIEQKVVPPRK